MNKINNEIDAIIKNVINKEKIPNNIYQEAFNNLDNINSKKSRYKHKRNIIKFVAVFSMIICISVLGVTLILKGNKPVVENDIANQNNGDVENRQDSTNSYTEEIKLPVASQSLYIDLSESEATRKFKSPIGMDMLVDYSQYIAVVSLDKILYYTNYQPATDTYIDSPFTVSKVTTKKQFKGNLPEQFEMISWGGVLPLSDYEKGAYKEQILKMGLNEMSEQYKKETYIDFISLMTIYMPKLEEGKDYLVYIRYNSAFEKNQVLDSFIYEYDIGNDKILNHETNEWIDFYI